MYIRYFVLLFFCCIASAGCHHDDNFVMHHVLDDYSWQIFTTPAINATIYLPVIILSKRGVTVFSSRHLNYDTPYKGFILNHSGHLECVDKSIWFINLSVTKNVLAIAISLLLLLGILLYCSIWYKKHIDDVPSGIVGVVEIFILYIVDNVIKPNIGDRYNTFTPYLLTVFFYIWLNNILGLLPGWANVTGDITVTACLALITFIVTNFNASKHYWSEILCPAVPRFLYPIMIPIECIGVITKPMTLMIRLFANITSGHIILLSIINLAFIFHSYTFGIIGILINSFMIILKLLVSFLQAYIFTLLSSIYIGSAIKK